MRRVGVGSPMRPFLLPASLAVAVLAAFIPAGAASPPEAREDGDKLVLQNDHVTVWFHGKKPMLKVFPTGNGSASFGYHFHEVVEYRDLDNDGLPSQAEIVARLSLEKASSFEVNITNEADGAVLVNLSLDAPVRLGGGGNPLLENVSVPDRDASIVLSFAIRDRAVTVDAGDVDVEVPETSIKWDFAVKAWPFVDAARNRLALDMKVDGEAVQEGALGSTAAEVSTNGTAVGILTWTTSAVGTTAAGEDVDVPVKVKLAAQAAGDAATGEADANATATRIVFTYDAADLETLLHDPTIGVVKASEGVDDVGETIADKVNEVPAPGLFALVAVVCLAATGLRRRS